MPPWLGFLDSQGSPQLTFRLFGFSPDHSRTFNAIVDTGFTGFLAISMVDALPVGLVLAGTTSTILADGSRSANLMALGTIDVDGETRLGTILINMAGNGPNVPLLGMEFSRSFDRSLIVSSLGVSLIENSTIQAPANQSQQPPPQGQTPPGS